MAAPSPASIPLAWSADSLATAGGVFTVFLFLWLLWFIYRRAGSLFFLRDLIWRTFGGKEQYDLNPELNALRRQMRDLELFRYEFNIPAQTLADADLARRWIVDNGFAPGEIGRSRGYIDWEDFNVPGFHERRFTGLRYRLWGALFMLLLVIVAPLPTLSETRYLAVTLKDAPEAPRFYLSENDIKFALWPDQYLTVEKCRSADTLQPFIQQGLPESRLDTLCSFFLDPGYTDHVREGLKEQRSLLLGLMLACMAGSLLVVLKLARMQRADKLHRQWLSNQHAPAGDAPPIAGN